MVIAILTLMISTYGLPDELMSGKTAVYVAIALVAAFVYAKDKNTSVDLKKIDITPQQEYQIKSVVEWLLKLLGYNMTVEKIPSIIPPATQPEEYLLTRLTAAATEREGMKQDIMNITDLVTKLGNLVVAKSG